MGETVAQSADSRQRVIERARAAYDAALVREQHKPTDEPLLTAARNLHYCVRTLSHEDAFYHCLDLFGLFVREDVNCSENWAAQSVDPDAEPDDALLTRVGAFVHSMECAADQYDPHMELAFTRLAAIARALYQKEVAARSLLRSGLHSLVDQANRVLDHRDT
jgi:hypothetical protein